MLDSFLRMFDTKGFPARWHCGAWSDGLGWLHIVSDLLVFGAYLAIPVLLLWFVRGRPDVPFPRVFWLFAAFILSCGFGHLLEAVIFWWPIYPFAGVVKATTATVSWATIFALVPLLPKAMHLQGLERANAELTLEIERRKQAEESMRQSEERYRSLVEATTSIVFIAEANGSFASEQTAWSRFTGQAMNEARGAGWLNAIHPDDRAELRSRWQAIAGSSEKLSFEARVWSAAARAHCHAVIRIVPLHASDGSVREWVGTVTDIEELRRAEAERRAIEARMQDAQRMESLGVLAGGIAHDFNNLLVGVLGNAGVAATRLPAESPARPLIANIETAATRAAELCRLMLAYAGKGDLVTGPLDVSGVVAEMIGLLRVSIAKDATLRCELADRLPSIEGDATQLRQVVMNLILNASESLEGKPGEIRVSTGVMDCDRAYLRETVGATELDVGRYVYFEVSDTGCGMDAATRARIFDPFFTTKFAGRGLGLAAALGIVRGHRGAVRIESQPRRGTVFRVLFPACAETAVRPSAARPEGVASATTGRVLVIDDDVAVGNVAEEVLNSGGFTVVRAASGAEGIAKFRSADIDTVLLDLTMPGLGGEETFRELRRIRPTARIVVTSGLHEQEVHRRFDGKGAAGFLRKPWRPEELIDAIRSAAAARV